MTQMFYLIILTLLSTLGGCASAAAAPSSPHAPAQKCEIRESAWCIDQGAFEIIDQRADDSVHDRVWIIRGYFKPESKLILLEPTGCRTGFSDTLVALGFDKNIKWRGKVWDRIRTRLKTDETCDMDVLIPPFQNDPMEWAFSVGLVLIRACPGESCTGRNMSIFRDQFERQFKQSE